MRIPDRRQGPVQSLGRATPAVEYDYNGMFEGIENLGQFLGAVGKDLRKREAAAQYNEAWSSYLNDKNSYLVESTSQPYKQVPVDPHKDMGTRTISRHTDILPEYTNYETQLRERIAGSITNDAARVKFLEDATLDDVKTRSALGQEAIRWQKTDAQTQILTSIENYASLGRWKDAEKAAIHGHSLGLFTPEQQARINRTIQGGQQRDYFASGVQAAETRVEFQALRDQLQNPELSGWMTPQQRSQVEAGLNQKVEDSLTLTLREVVEKKGLKMGKRFIQRANSASADELGFSSQDDKYAAITRMQEIWGDYSWGRKQEEVNLELVQRKAALASGAPADPKSKLDRKAMNELWAETTEGVPEFSVEWNAELSRFAFDKGWIPPDAESTIRANLYSGDAVDVAGAAQSLTALQTLAPHAVQNMNQDDLAFGFLIANNSRAGVPPIDTINRHRDGIYRVNDSIRKARQRRFNSEISPNQGIRDTLESVIDDDPVADPWFRSQAIANEDMVAEYGELFRQEYIRTGDTQSAAQLAYSSIRNVWGLTDTTGRLKFQKFSPETMTPKGTNPDGAPAGWVKEQFEADMAEAGITIESDTELVFNGIQPGRNEWFILNRNEAGIIDFATDKEGNIAMWSPDYETSPERIREDAEAKKKEQAAKKAQERTAHMAGEPSPAEKIYGEPWISGEDWKSGLATVAEGLHEGAVQAWWMLFEGIPELWNKMPHRQFERFKEKMIRYEKEFKRSGFPSRIDPTATLPALPKGRKDIERTKNDPRYLYQNIPLGEAPRF